VREATSCLKCEHLAQRATTLEDRLLQTIQRIARLEKGNVGYIRRTLASSRS
jgi:hypothetical protein